ncbi:UNVERIFIED_CONTAM: hypothetical protein GTU68_003571 [Idotea baltica]|nr:hypothetical protein [Idotea baltica]
MSVTPSTCTCGFWKAVKNAFKFSPESLSDSVELDQKKCSAFVVSSRAKVWSESSHCTALASTKSKSSEAASCVVRSCTSYVAASARLFV